MGYTMKVDGFEEFSEKLTQLGDSAPGVASQALYDGAGVMADAVTKSAETIRTEKFHYSVFPGATTRLPSPESNCSYLK